MIREEYDFCDVKEYLNKKNDLLIVGEPCFEDRSKYFYNLWNSNNKDILVLKKIDIDSICYRYLESGVSVKNGTISLSYGIHRLFKGLNIDQKNTLLDLSSLDHILIMFLSKVLITQTIPRALFASYIRPEKYSVQSGDIGFSLSDGIIGVKSVPGFVKRESDIQTLCSFIGFEGNRLKSIIESVNNVNKFVPIVAFPSGEPQWYNVTMWNCMEILQSEPLDFAIHKCFSESIFEAIGLLQTCIQPDEKVVLAPLGTRCHSMASAIFACKHPHTRIIYDNAIEKERRTEGIACIKIYHLSSFLNT